MQKDQKKKVINQFKMHTTDTGSPSVQIAILTKRIKELTEHLKENKKDHSSRRGLLQMVAKRRKLLITLKREEVERYEQVIRKLELTRDIARLEKQKAEEEARKKALKDATQKQDIKITAE